MRPGGNEMFSNNHDGPSNYSWACHHLRLALAVSVLLACISTAATAQLSYDSGSTGADGAFSPTQTQSIQLPASGVFNFTTVNIPQNVRITFIRNARNTPVTILASGNISIAGTISLDGGAGSASNTINGTDGGGLGGPGGFDGGRGGTTVAGVTNRVSRNGPGAGGGGGHGWGA